MNVQPGALRISAVAGSRVGKYRCVVVAVIWAAFFFFAFDRAAISLLLTGHGFLKEMNLDASPGRQGLLMTFLPHPPLGNVSVPHQRRANRRSDTLQASS